MKISYFEFALILRKRIKLSRKALAEKASVSVKAVKKFESGDQSITLEEIARIILIIGMTLSFGHEEDSQHERDGVDV